MQMLRVTATTREEERLQHRPYGVGSVRVGKRLSVRLPAHRQHAPSAVHQLNAIVGLWIMAGGDDHAGGAAREMRTHSGQRAAAEHGGGQQVARGAEPCGAVGELHGARPAVRGGGGRVLRRDRAKVRDVHRAVVRRSEGHRVCAAASSKELTSPSSPLARSTLVKVGSCQGWAHGHAGVLRRRVRVLRAVFGCHPKRTNAWVNYTQTFLAGARGAARFLFYGACAHTTLKLMPTTRPFSRKPGRVSRPSGYTANPHRHASRPSHRRGAKQHRHRQAAGSVPVSHTPTLNKLP